MVRLSSGTFTSLFYLSIHFSSSLSFLADLLLVDKIVVYDLAGQRIGWADYDCKFRNELYATFMH